MGAAAQLIPLFSGLLTRMHERRSNERVEWFTCMTIAIVQHPVRIASLLCANHLSPAHTSLPSPDIAYVLDLLLNSVRFVTRLPAEQGTVLRRTTVVQFS
jgi:hypothetical protein